MEIDVKDGKLDLALVVLAAGMRAGVEDESFYGDMDRRVEEAASVPDIANRFKLAVMITPWWSMSADIGAMPDPGCGEYDFPFYDFNINEGDEFDYAKLVEIIQRGIEQINSRG